MISVRTAKRIRWEERHVTCKDRTEVGNPEVGSALETDIVGYKAG